MTFLQPLTWQVLPPKPQNLDVAAAFSPHPIDEADTKQQTLKIRHNFGSILAAPPSTAADGAAPPLPPINFVGFAVNLVHLSPAQLEWRRDLPFLQGNRGGGGGGRGGPNVVVKSQSLRQTVLHCLFK